MYPSICASVDLRLAISESSRLEGIEYLKLKPELSVNISADADEWFQPMDVAAVRQEVIRNQYGLVKPFVLYAGLTTARMGRLIGAYARLPEVTAIWPSIGNCVCLSIGSGSAKVGTLGPKTRAWQK